MVKSFKGVEQEKPKDEGQPTSVADYMSRRLITFKPDQTMDQVIQTLLEKRISGGPVVDEDNNLVGVISEGDCLKEAVKGKYTSSTTLSGKVSEHMASNVRTVEPERNIFECAQMFLDLKLRRFPVLQDGKLIGQISQRDIMRAVKALKDIDWK